MKSVQHLILARLTSIEGLLRAQSNASLSTAEAAEYLGVSERTLLRYVESGRLSAIDMSTEPGGAKRGRITFTRAELDRFRDANALTLDV